MYILRVLRLPGARFLILRSPLAVADLIVMPGVAALPHGRDLWAVGGTRSHEKNTGQEGGSGITSTTKCSAWKLCKNKTVARHKQIDVELRIFRSRDSMGI